MGNAVAMNAPPTPPRGVAARMRSIVLLAGGVRRSSLAHALGRPLVDLPLPSHASMLDAWGSQASQLAQRLGRSVTVRAMVSQQLQLPRSVASHAQVTVHAEYDKGEFRGTGGLLRDLTDEYADDDFVLVGTANQVMLTPLHELFELVCKTQERTGADVVLLAEPDGSASGLQFIRCASLRSIRGNGYLDFKEQSLPAIAKDFVVKVARATHPAVLPVRTLDQYIRTLRVLFTGDLERAQRPDPYSEEWTATFSMVDETATVAKSALVHDAVVMRNAQVGAGAVLVRSLVCEGATVAPGQVICDAVVASPANGASSYTSANTDLSKGGS